MSQQGRAAILADLNKRERIRSLILSRNSDAGRIATAEKLHLQQPQLAAKFYACSADPLNRARDRYSNILPYDRTRVALWRQDAQLAENTYINASWVSEPVAASNKSAPRCWIAAQAPLDHTIHDFLSLLFEAPGTARDEGTLAATPPPQAPRIVVMLTACTESGKEKSARYWPSRVGESVSFAQHSPVQGGVGHSDVTWRDGNLQPVKVTYRCSVPSSELDAQRKRGWRTNGLRLTSSGQSVDIDHVEFLGWQDHGVPDSPEDLFALLRHLSELGAAYDPSTPVVVHCSAGVGRTGSLIAVSSLIALHEAMRTSPSEAIVLDQLHRKMAESPLGPLLMSPAASKSPLSNIARKIMGAELVDTGALDIVAAVIDYLREQRTMMVQTDGQIKYVYDCFVAWREQQAG